MENYEDQNVSSENENIPVGDVFADTEQVEYQPEPAVEYREEPMVERYEAPVQSRQEESSYRGIGTGRKESPYANAPYVMNHQPRNEYYYQPQPEHRSTAGRYQTQYEAPRKPKAKKKKGGFWKKALAAVAALVLVIGSCGVTAYLVNEQWEDRAERMEESFNQQLQDLQVQVTALLPENTGNSVSGTVSYIDVNTASQVYAQNVQSVVLIESTITSSYYGQTATGISAGSGFILTEDGYVVTNYHVIEGATTVSVSMVDGTKYPAQVVGYDSTNDVAVLKINATGLDPVTLGSSTDLIVGDQVVAIGNPLGELTSTLTVGYVSAKERDVSTDGTIINMLQTDCAINSGNSGGPLFNMRGEVVGITTAKYSGSSSSGATIEGIGFAIPMDDVLEGINELIEYGFIKTAYLGVVVQNMDATTAEVYGLPIGAYVVSVEEGYSAHRAGIQAKDIIIAVGDTAIESLTDLTRALRDYEPGDTVAVTIYRSGLERTLQVTLDERPADVDTVVPETETEETMPEGNFEDWYNYFAPYFGYGNGNGG